MADSTPSPLNIAIIGAGIGGLTAALYLRQNGHNVTLYERSRFAHEYGAAIHLAPNANGLLKRLGIDMADDGGIPTETICEGGRDGKIKKVIPVGKNKAMWQHGWLFAHRRTLHERLKTGALKKGGKGRPVELRTSCGVNEVGDNGELVLVDGSRVKADAVIGADGVNSVARQVVVPGIKTRSSGKNAYRFLLKKEDLKKAEPEAYELVKNDGQLISFYDLNRRIVSFPADYNEWLNLVCTHPEELSDGGEHDWNRQGDKSRMLEIFNEFDPKLKAILNQAPDDSLKVWKLLDLEPLPTWTKGRLALLGDAAHPFLPYNGQGGACAIEDGASIGVMLPLGTTPDEIAERFQLYQQARKKRADELQEYSRVAGYDLKPDAMDMAGRVMARLAAFAYGHDEFHHSTDILRLHLQNKAPDGLIWRSPVGFGPMPGPRQRFNGMRHDTKSGSYRAVSVRMKTSRTLLQNFLPRRDVLSFASPSTVAEVTWKYQENNNLAWLSGRGYNHLSLYLHGVQCKKPDGSVLVGDFLAIMLEDAADPVITGRDELGFPKLFCELEADLSLDDGANDVVIRASWRGAEFMKITLPEPKVKDQVTNGSMNGEQKPKRDNWGPPLPTHAGILTHRYVPAVGRKGEADADYIVCVPPLEGEEKPSKEKEWTSMGAEIVFNRGSFDCLPTLHHIVDRLEELPNYGIVEASIMEGKGVSDHKSIYRVF